MVINPFPVLKEAAIALKTAGNLDLYARLMDQMRAIIDLKEENAELRQKLKGFDDAAALIARRSVVADTYFIDGDDGPYCTACWDKAGKPVRLHVGSRDDGMGQCPVCKCWSVFDREKHRAAKEAKSHRLSDRMSRRSSSFRREY